MRGLKLAMPGTLADVARNDQRGCAQAGQKLFQALDLLETVYRAIAGEHPNWNEYRQAMVRDERVVIRIRPERASGQVY